jgi:hypothetical protein
MRIWICEAEWGMIIHQSWPRVVNPELALEPFSPSPPGGFRNLGTNAVAKPPNAGNPNPDLRAEALSNNTCAISTVRLFLPSRFARSKGSVWLKSEICLLYRNLPMDERTWPSLFVQQLSGLNHTNEAKRLFK